MTHPILENMKRITQDTLDGYNALDADQIMAPRSKDCMYYSRPQSLAIPPRSNKEYLEFFHTTVKPLFSDFKTTVDSIVYDAEARKSVIHGVSSGNTPAGLYEMELVLPLGFSINGEEIDRLDEMFDSAYYTSFMAKVEEVMHSQTGK